MLEYFHNQTWKNLIARKKKKKKKQIWQLKEARSLQYKDIIHEINPKKNTWNTKNPSNKMDPDKNNNNNNNISK